MNKNCLTFQIKHFGQYSMLIGILQFENFQLVLHFTVYNLNDL